jgi:hypothetical protein
MSNVMRHPERGSYGHMLLSLVFRPALSLEAGGFRYRRKHYGWSQVERVRLWHVAWPGIGKLPDAKLLPRASVHLHDGSVMHFRGEVLAKRGAPLLAGYVSAFDELVALFVARRREARRLVAKPHNPSIERTSESLLRKLSVAAHVER